MEEEEEEKGRGGEWKEGEGEDKVLIQMGGGEDRNGKERASCGFVKV